MASFNHACLFFVSIFLIFFTFPSPSMAGINTARKLFALVKPQSPVLKYHNGPLLMGNITVNLVWYGKFTPSQRSVLVDFLQSLGSHTKAHSHTSSVSSWWQTIGGYRGGPSALIVGNHVLDEKGSLGKLLTTRKLIALASKGGGAKGTHDAVNIVLTADDVVVEGFCSSRCGTHGSVRGKRKGIGGPTGSGQIVYAWLGNSVSQCPGQCAWPFHRPIYGPQTPPLVAPSGDVGVDGMVINLATVLAGTVTNPHGSGYFQGPPDAPLESVSACAGIFGKGAYPGYPGEVLVDKTTGASYNAVGVNGRKFLLPAMWDPRTSTCKTLD